MLRTGAPTLLKTRNNQPSEAAAFPGFGLTAFQTGQSKKENKRKTAESGFALFAVLFFILLKNGMIKDIIII